MKNGIGRFLDGFQTQCGIDCGRNRAFDGVIVAETHFLLGGMDVYIDLRRRDFYEKNRCRTGVAAQARIRFLELIGD